MIDWELFTAESVKKVEEAFPPIGDFHSANSTAMYGTEQMKTLYKTDYKTFKDIYRSNAKIAGLALLYGGSFKVIDAKSEAEQRSIYTSFFSTIKGFKKHLQEIEAHARKNLWTSNLFGMRIWLKDINHKDWKIAAAVKRRLFNYPIQSSGCDLILTAMHRLVKFSERTDTNVFAGDNIHKIYYNRIVAIDKATADSIQDELETMPQGNVLVCVKENGKIVSAWDKYLAIDTDFIAKHSAEVVL